jgi:DnaJ-class molecular chaperone
MFDSYYETLGLPNNASKEEIKKKYKSIALTCHPDKLLNIKDENEKNKKIEKFKNATIAYKKIINNEICLDDLEDFENFDWSKNFFNMFNEEDANIFMNIASNFINNKIYPKTYYKPPVSKKIIKHEITFNVSYNEVKYNLKKKLRLFLINIKEPIFIEVYCGNYPVSNKIYIDDNDNEHEIIINLVFKENEKYYHEIDNDIINLITDLEINLLEHITGCKKIIKYIDKKDIEISIEPFSENKIVLDELGIIGGKLIVNLRIKPLSKENWDIIDIHNKGEMIRILNIMHA